MAAESDTPLVPAADQRGRQPGQLRVLVAEDDDVVRKALKAVVGLDASLNVVAEVGDATAAVEIAAAERPDVAILDVGLPQGGGVWAAREITNRSPETKVLAFSGHADEGTVNEMLDAGAVGYVVKGSSVETILSSIAEAAGSKDLNRNGR